MGQYFLIILMMIFSHQIPISYLKVEAKVLGGFSIELIHRDSQLSPFYNHSATLGELARNDALRSIARVNQLFCHPSSSKYIVDENKVVESVTIPSGGGGDYLMKLSIGSPPVEVLAIADTGSDLVWVQCQPCDQCYPQDRPLFDPVKSSTFKELSCDSESCGALSSYNECGSTKNECQYSIIYGDKSYSKGVLATDIFTFDSTEGQVAAIQNTIFGCGYNNHGTFDSHGSGLVGLGGGPLSLVSRLAADQIEPKFSYCLLPWTIKDYYTSSVSKLTFGQNAVISGSREGVVSTPLISKDPPTFYYLTLEGASVGGKKIENNATEGNIIIDSGTTLTLLETNFYNDLEAEVKEVVGLYPVLEPPQGYNLCYNKTSFRSVPEMTIVFHFTGADLSLKTLNTFRDFDADVTCFTMVFTNNDVMIFGN
uniref:Peptidase A1 domain-containing protein n=1 Tax=Davidia involucrata TaxID=16924 RepID=A0A5B6YWH6_DAVIN